MGPRESSVIFSDVIFKGRHAWGYLLGFFVLTG